MNKKTIDIFDAIAQMRELSKLKKSFSFSFMSYYRSKQTTEGIVIVEKGVLRASTHKDNNENADFMMNYKNLLTGKPKQFYQLTLMTFNGMEVTPN